MSAPEPGAVADRRAQARRALVHERTSRPGGSRSDRGHAHEVVAAAHADVALGGLNSIDDDDSSFTLGGGYEFSEYLSLEAAYRDFGNQAGQTDCPRI